MYEDGARSSGASDKAAVAVESDSVASCDATDGSDAVYGRLPALVARRGCVCRYVVAALIRRVCF